jgi:hypothetical protein
VGVVVVFILFKGWVEVAAGIRFLELVRRGDDPRQGWREFATWLFLVASLILVVAALLGLHVLWKELLGSA